MQPAYHHRTTAQTRPMNLILRLFWLIFSAKRRSAVPTMGPCESQFRVLPNDLDILRHMNNGRYFSIMDLARVDLMLRSGLWPQLGAAGWYPVVVHAAMTFKRSLKLGQPYTVTTTVLGWDEKNLVLAQVFESAGVEMARGHVKARFLKKSGGSATTAELLAMSGYNGPTPVLPTELAGWLDAPGARDDAVAAKR